MDGRGEAVKKTRAGVPDAVFTTAELTDVLADFQGLVRAPRSEEVATEDGFCAGR